MQDAARADARAVHQRAIGADVALCADLHIAADEGTGTDLRPPADPHIRPDHDQRADADVLAEFDVIGDHRARVHTRLATIRREQLQCADETGPGPRDPQQVSPCRRGEVLADDHTRGRRALYGIGQLGAVGIAQIVRPGVAQ